MSVKVPGVGQRYGSPAEARADAAAIRDLGDREAEDLREQGREGEADRAQDRAHALAAKIEAAANDAEHSNGNGNGNGNGSKQAGRTAKRPPAARPTTRKPRARSRASSSSARRSSSSGPLVTPTLRRAYTRSGAAGQAASWTTLALQVAGLTLGMALLTLFVTRKGGPKAFADLANAAASAVGLLVDPIDPFNPPKASSVPPGYTHPPGSPPGWVVPVDPRRGGGFQASRPASPSSRRPVNA